jgi:cellulose synthase/poly-beta-1,6-N-acetylglucosamine synthase-like glycosyltransferase
MLSELSTRYTLWRGCSLVLRLALLVSLTSQEYRIYGLTIKGPALLHQLYQMLSVRGRKRPKLRLRGDNVPTVDVFVTCCKEDVDVVLDTARAACAVDYPQDRFRVVVLDDGKDAELEKAIGDLSIAYPNLHYHARIKIEGVPHHFKAGNLTGGTEFVTKLEGGGGEFIAALDADMIPELEWLRSIIAHMVIDEGMALVCPPQVCRLQPPSTPLYPKR